MSDGTVGSNPDIDVKKLRIEKTIEFGSPWYVSKKYSQERGTKNYSNKIWAKERYWGWESLYGYFSKYGDILCIFDAEAYSPDKIGGTPLFKLKEGKSRTDALIKVIHLEGSDYHGDLVDKLWEKHST